MVVRSSFDVFTEIGMIDDFDSYFEDLYEFFAKDAWEIFEDTLPFLEEAKKRDFKLIITSNLTLEFIMFVSILEYQNILIVSLYLQSQVLPNQTQNFFLNHYLMLMHH